MRVKPPTTLRDEGGLIPAHCAARHRETWVDVGLTAPGGRFDPPFYRALLLETERLLDAGDADLFFFMHKPPGVRWRFRAADGMPVEDLRRAVLHAAVRLLGPGGVRTSVYEPQQALFGGAASMRFVHKSWCQDSLLWLRWHADHERSSPGSRWEVSFAVLAHVFACLGIVGWEDREVWACISEDTGRRLADREWSRPEVVRLATSRRSRWNELWPAPAGRSNRGHQALFDQFRAVSDPIFTGWREDCLSRPVTQFPLSPRRAAAYWAVFHWNRAGLSGAQQALTAQALSA